MKNGEASLSILEKYGGVVVSRSGHQSIALKVEERID
jgi:hypothetical protein